MSVASIEKILHINEHTNATLLELATIKGWQVCVKKGEFKENELCVYIQVDSIMEDHPVYEFLRNKHFRIKTIRLRGLLSQGIAFPLSILKSFEYTGEVIEGMDVSTIIKASHYEKPVPPSLMGRVKGFRPSWIKKTDESNIKNNPLFINEMFDLSYVITLKMDGCSGTYFVKDNEFGVCSRNMELKPEENNVFWKIAYKYDIENKLKAHYPNKNIAVQGEVYGFGIQDNIMGNSDVDFAAFNLFDIDSQTYLGHLDLLHFTDAQQIPMVYTIERGDNFKYTLKELQLIGNKLTYKNGNYAEGMVIRPLIEQYSNVLKSRMSGKIINEEFELKYG